MMTIVDALCICAGIRRDVLNRVPAGRGHAATLGLIMILVAVISAFTSGYALSRVFLGESYVDVVAVVGGIIWAALVFSIDRLMILSLDKFGSTQKLVTQLVLRIPLALVIAAVMSTPFILRLSENVTNAELLKERRDTVEREFAANSKEAGLAEQQAAVRKLEAARQAYEQSLMAEPSSFEYKEAKTAAELARANYQSVQGANAQRVARAVNQIERINQGGTDGNLGPNEPSRVAALQKSIQSLRAETAAAQHAAEAADSRLADATHAWQAKETEDLELTKQHLNTAAAAATHAEALVTAHNQESEKGAGPLFRSTLINQYRTYRRITSNPSHPDYAAMKTFEFGMHLLFLILELTPLGMKALARKGPMDDATAAAEQLDSDRINGDANNTMARRQSLAAARRAVEDAAVENWKNSLIAKLQLVKLQTVDLSKLNEELDRIAA
jgi:hypothetical protein